MRRIGEQSAPVREAMRKWATALTENKEEFPLSREQTEALTGQEHCTWEHPLQQISHALLSHYKVVDEPFMLASQQRDPADGGISSTSCHCFYATVSFSNLGIIVYDNWGEGNMCAEIPENVRAFLPYPDWLLPHMPALHAAVEEKAGVPCANYDEPKPGYAWPEPTGQSICLSPSP